MNSRRQDSLALDEVGNDIRKLQATITKAVIALADRVESLRTILPANAVEGFLATECGVPRQEIPFYRKFVTTFDKYRNLLASKRISPSVMKAMLSARPEIRQETLTRIAGGAAIDVSDVTAIARDLKRLELSDTEVVRQQRLSLLNRRACAHARRVSVDTNKRILVLLARINRFSERYLEWSPADDYPDAVVWTREQYHREHGSIKRAAARALPFFEQAYGQQLPRSEWDSNRKKSPSKVSLAMAHEALKQFAEGDFPYDRDFISKPNEKFPDHFNIWIALEFLAPEARPVADLLRCPVAEPPFKLSSLEICAGAGGQAIGLNGAGFSHVALYENNKVAAETLRQNWPQWKVVEADVNNVSFRQYKGVDLLCGGIPCQPYSRDGNQTGENDSRDLFKQTVRIIDEVKPKAFFFENVLGMTFAKHASYRATTVAEFSKLGYDILIHRINGLSVGLAQARERIVIVGMPKGTLHRFRMPVETEARGVGAIIGDLLMVNRVAAEDRPQNGETKESYSNDQRRFDLWADHWLTKYGSEKVTTITSSVLSGRPMPNTFKRWQNAGFDLTRKVGHPPSLDDMIGLDDKTCLDFLPTPTPAMMQRLQDFPDRWVLCGEPSERSQQVANAFPPAMARTIGVAIYTALTGIRFDMSNLRATSPIPLHEIGSKEARMNLNRRAQKVHGGDADNTDNLPQRVSWSPVQMSQALL